MQCLEATRRPAAFTFQGPIRPANALLGQREIVYLVHDDDNVREGIADLVAALGKEVMTFGTGAEYLRWRRTDAAACMVLDLMLPDMCGLELQSRLSLEDCPPIIFISGRASISATVRAMKGGAFEFLTKPINARAVQTAVDAALEQDRQRRQTQAALATIRQRFATLTARERQVLPLIAEGLLNKQAAVALGISEVTLQVHRGQIMRKMSARSFADLVRMAGKLGIPAPDCPL
jgi:FixJ family two-component response regulator